MKIKVLPFFLLFALVFITGCVSNPVTVNSTANNSPLAVAVGDHVSVDYTGRLENGTIFDSSSGRASLEFDVGAGQMISGFDSAVVGMREGEKKTVTLRPEDAYGMQDPSLIVKVPLANVPNGTKVGDELYTRSNQRVVVTDVTNETVTIDANHFLAGKTLVFDIGIVKIVKKK